MKEIVVQNLVIKDINLDPAQRFLSQIDEEKNGSNAGSLKKIKIDVKNEALLLALLLKKSDEPLRSISKSTGISISSLSRYFNNETTQKNLNLLIKASSFNSFEELYSFSDFYQNTLKKQTLSDTETTIEKEFFADLSKFVKKCRENKFKDEDDFEKSKGSLINKGQNFLIYLSKLSNHENSSIKALHLSKEDSYQEGVISLCELIVSVNIIKDYIDFISSKRLFFTITFDKLIHFNAFWFFNNFLNLSLKNLKVEFNEQIQRTSQNLTNSHSLDFSNQHNLMQDLILTYGQTKHQVKNIKKQLSSDKYTLETETITNKDGFVMNQVNLEDTTHLSEKEILNPKNFSVIENILNKNLANPHRFNVILALLAKMRFDTEKTQATISVQEYAALTKNKKNIKYVQSLFEDIFNVPIIAAKKVKLQNGDELERKIYLIEEIDIVRDENKNAKEITISISQSLKNALIKSTWGQLPEEIVQANLKTYPKVIALSVYIKSYISANNKLSQLKRQTKISTQNIAFYIYGKDLKETKRISEFLEVLQKDLDYVCKYNLWSYKFINKDNQNLQSEPYQPIKKEDLLNSFIYFELGDKEQRELAKLRQIQGLQKNKQKDSKNNTKENISESSEKEEEPFYLQ